MYKLIVICSLVLCLGQTVNGCSLTNWHKMEDDERLLVSDIVVYGKTVRHTVANLAINAEFQVYCVMKADEEPVHEMITIERIAPRDGCSAKTKYTRVGDEAIVMLKRTPSGNYEWHEVMPMLTAVLSPSRRNMMTISSLCQLQLWLPPDDATAQRCPICGAANFTAASIEADGDDLSSCLFGTVGNTLDDCINEATPRDEICISEYFYLSCTQVSYVPTFNSTCECKPVNKNPNVFSGAKMNTAHVILIFLILSAAVWNL